ncbi:hypothetical protein [Staphylococcus carnosus]|uniref:Uncharacterized protein n=1 Tax=Staphylococcus carnosus TaxID=1281 RepID=A0AAJ0JQS2_STACA|nr:hypothetical protein [Staphylococcus carnosus]KKB25711.1 hypothetical protein VV61_03685 [Staphylococcus carnosus]POA01978.1 hypothetical protein CD153_07175 [Staphylococcus carnosus]QQS84220.1 hypothetical protein I6J04_07220 [Staphylococcus carnosus]QRQ04161.1 hypothetical protein I6J34_07615 [Staphylococcus carnosus]UTB83838.1 hypothetical protein A2I67_11450 [Staphylococcus carnosus]
MEQFPFSIKGNKLQLLAAIEAFNKDFTKSHSGNVPEEQIYREFAKYISNTEKQLIESLIMSETDTPALPSNQAYEMEYLMTTNYLMSLEKDSYYIDVNFLNKYNQYVLGGKYRPLTPLDDEEMEMLIDMHFTEEAREEYEHLYLRDYLSNFYVKDLKEICRIFKIKGFSKGNEDYIINLIEDKLMEDPFELFERLSPDALGLIAYFMIENRNTIPYDEMGELDLEVFIIGKDELSHILYMPVDVFEFLQEYFAFKGIDPLDLVSPEEREMYEELAQMKKLQAMTDKAPENVEDAIAAFAEAGQDEGMRDMIAELIRLKEDDEDEVAQVITQIMDGKIKTEEDLAKLFEQIETEDDESNNTEPPQSNNNSNIIDFNQYRK